MCVFRPSLSNLQESGMGDILLFTPELSPLIHPGIVWDIPVWRVCFSSVVVWSFSSGDRPGGYAVWS